MSSNEAYVGPAHDCGRVGDTWGIFSAGTCMACAIGVVSGEGHGWTLESFSRALAQLRQSREYTNGVDPEPQDTERATRAFAFWSRPQPNEVEARRLFDVWPDCTGVRVVVSVLRGTAARVVSVHVGFEDGVTHESIPLPVREGQPTSEVVREIVDELIVNAEDEGTESESASNSE